APARPPTAPAGGSAAAPASVAAAAATCRRWTSPATAASSGGSVCAADPLTSPVPARGAGWFRIHHHTRAGRQRPVLGSGSRTTRSAGLDRRPPQQPGALTTRRAPMEGPEIHYAEAKIDNGRFGTRTIRFETGRLAKQAAGAVLATLDDDTTLLSTTTADKHPKDHFDFFPLTVDV